MDVAVLFCVFVGGLVSGLPVAITLGVSSLCYLLLAGIPPVVMPQKMYAGMDVFVLLSIPGFILAGNLMNRGGITQRIIRFANSIVGWIKGGLGLTNIAASMLFGGITGAAVADAASIGGVMIPGMKKVGYPADFSAAVTAASSTVGPIIPPSVPMIIVGALSGISVGQMFLAGAVPGILMGVAMMVTAYVISARRNFPRQEWQGVGEVVRAFGGAFWALAMTFLIFYGLLSGLVTPTETAVVASAYAFIVRAFIYRELPISKLPAIIVESGTSAAGILALVGVCLFVCAGIARLPLMPVVVAILPFLLTNIAVLLAVSYIPALATWLPSLLSR
ncbi:tripartite ATP-independent transporter DctM subunit [Roseovarius sp. MBR-154]|jgi:tripartite ATP-independent transporter DctM subunit